MNAMKRHGCQGHISRSTYSRYVCAIPASVYVCAVAASVAIAASPPLIARAGRSRSAAVPLPTGGCHPAVWRELPLDGPPTLRLALVFESAQPDDGRDEGEAERA